MKVNVRKLKDTVQDVFDRVMKEKELKADPSVQTKEMLQKHNPLQKAIYDLLGEQFQIFIRQIDWVSPKPTTFRVVFKNSEIFFLKWLGKNFQAQISGKRYDLGKEYEYQQALDALGELLKYAPPVQEAENGFENDSDTPGGGGGGGAGNFPGEEGEAGESGVDIDVPDSENTTIDVDSGEPEEDSEALLKKEIPTA